MSLGPLMVDIAGTELSPDDARVLSHPLVGSVILFTRNYRDPRQLDSPEDYVLFNPANPSIPAQAPTLRRGWERIMRSIGISDIERKERNLVPPWYTPSLCDEACRRWAIARRSAEDDTA